MHTISMLETFAVKLCGWVREILPCSKHTCLRMQKQTRQQALENCTCSTKCSLRVPGVVRIVDAISKELVFCFHGHCCSLWSVSLVSFQYCHSVGQNTWKHAVLLLMQQFSCPDFYFTFLKNNKIFHNLVLYRILDVSWCLISSIIVYEIVWEFPK